MGGIAINKITTFRWKRKRGSGSGPKIDRFQNTNNKMGATRAIDTGEWGKGERLNLSFQLTLLVSMAMSFQGEGCQ